MNTTELYETYIAPLEDKVSKLEERLERGGGCVAATCCAGRAAGKEQGVAERAEPSRAAHVAPEEAEAYLSVTVEYIGGKSTGRYVDSEHVSTEQLKAEIEGIMFRAAMHARLDAKAESRKANAGIPLEHDQQSADPTPSTVET